MGYGFQIWMCRPKGVYRADGAMGQFSVVVPDKDMVISLNETATGAHWAQNTLNILWEFLEEVSQEESLPEAPQESAALKKRMAALALPQPPFVPDSPMAKEISGQWFQVEEGEFTLRKNPMGRLSGTVAGGSISRFKLDMNYGLVTLAALEDGKETVYRIATDGTRFINSVEGTGLPITRLSLHGWWSGEDTFSIGVRWVETCFEDRLDLHFTQEGVLIRREAVIGGFGPVTSGDEAVKAKRC